MSKDKNVEDLKYWNTRIVRHHIVHHFESGDFVDEYYYAVHEVHYDSNDKPCAWAEKPIDMSFISREDLQAIFEHIQDAIERTVLELEEIDGEHGELIESGKYIEEYEE